MGYSKSNTSPIFELPVSARRTDGADPEALTPQITPPPQATYAQYAATSYGGHGYWHASGDLHRQCPLWVISGHLGKRGGGSTHWASATNERRVGRFAV